MGQSFGLFNLFSTFATALENNAKAVLEKWQSGRMR